MADPGGVRIGDADRQRVVDMLRRHTGEGRLTLDEFAERTGQVYEAQTRDELAAVLADLPDDLRPPASAEGTLAPPRRRRFLAVMSGSRVRGPWRAPPRIGAFAWWGSVTIDLTNASIESPVVDIRAWAIMGAVVVRVPEGIPIDLRGIVVMGSTENNVKNTPAIPGAPVIRVHSRGLWGAVVVKTPRKGRGRHRPHGLAPGDIHDLVGETVADAVDRARRSIDRALGPGSLSDRIPPLPGRERAPAERSRPQRHRHRSRANGDATGRDGDPPSREPTEPPAAARPAAPSTAEWPGAATPPGTPAASDGGAGGDGGAASDGQGSPTGDGRVASRIPPGTLTILVSDIVGSTQLAERLGDQAWLEVLQAHNALVRHHICEHGGTEVKAQGDGFLIVFPSARAAVLAAIAVQRAMERYRKDNPEVPVLLRLGLHTGEVVATDDDIFGQNVVVATRIADLAAPGEIVVSGLTRDLTASASDLGFESGKDVELKGISQPWRVHRVLV